MGVKVEEEAPKGAPEWLVTFSDLVSLLVTLFIMMLTFTTQEKDKLNKVLALLKGGFGVVTDEIREKPAVAENPIQWNVTDNGVIVPDPDEDPKLENFIRELEGFALEESELEAGKRIVPETTTCFAPGDDRPSPEFEEEVRRLARGLRKHRARTIRVEGFADLESDKRNRVGTPTFLALARARRIARLMGLEGVQLTQLAVTSKGTTRPRGEAWNDAGQARNRRVEIVILPIKKERTG